MLTMDESRMTNDLISGSSSPSSSSPVLMVLTAFSSFQNWPMSSLSSSSLSSSSSSSFSSSSSVLSAAHSYSESEKVVLEHSSNSSSMIVNCSSSSSNFLFECINATNVTESNEHMYGNYSISVQVILGIILFLLTIITAIGNACVVMAIFKDRNLQTLQNYLICSLAIADFLVSLTVMPFAAWMEIQGKWTLGSLFCDLWTSADVFCCTSSILHLVLIALDRYWAVTDVNYSVSRAPIKIKSAIAIVWITSLALCIAPHLGMKDDDFEGRILRQECIISQDVNYQIVATMATFYVPSAAILVLYYKIYNVARRQIRNRPGASSVAPAQTGVRPVQLELNEGEPAGDHAVKISTISGMRKKLALKFSLTKNGRSTNQEQEASTGHVTIDLEPGPSNCDGRSPAKKQDSCESTKVPKVVAQISSRDQLAKERERKTARVLAIITGVFIICWLPFFLTTLFSAILGYSVIENPIVSSVFLWLGYVNSLLNPIIYTIFSPDFRSAFEKMINCRR